MKKVMMFAAIFGCVLTNALFGVEDAQKKDLMTASAWNLSKGSDPAGIKVEDNNGTFKMILNPHGKYFSMRTTATPITDELRKNGKIISFKAKNNGVNAYFAILLEFIGADGAILSKKVLYSASPKQKPRDWRQVAKTIAANGDLEIPSKAVAMSIRMAFSPNKGVCEGVMEVADMKLEDTPPADWPKKFTVECGDLKVSFDARTFWNISRIDFKNKQLGTEDIGFYGTVAMFKDIGFIGSGHTENESEVVLSKKLLIDGKEVSTPKDLTKCAQMQLSKKSRLRSLEVTTTVTVKDDRIVESVSIEALKPENLDLIYNFMHPWVLDFSNYIGETTKGEIVTGKFVDDKGFHLNKPVKWSGVYSEKLKMGQVTYLPEVPKDFKFIVKYWDNPNNNYRKHYFQTMQKTELKPGTTYKYKAVLGFYEANIDNWQQTAKELSAKLKESPTVHH